MKKAEIHVESSSFSRSWIIVAGLLLSKILRIGVHSDRLVESAVSGSSVKRVVVLKGSLGDGRGGASVTSWHW